MRVGEWLSIYQAATLRRVGPAPSLGTTEELALQVWVQVSQPCFLSNVALGALAAAVLESLT